MPDVWVGISGNEHALRLRTIEAAVEATPAKAMDYRLRNSWFEREVRFPFVAVIQSEGEPSADLGEWNRDAVERAPSVPRSPTLFEWCAPSNDLERKATPAPNPDNLPVDREEGSSKGRYFVRLDGVEAEMTYSRAGDRHLPVRWRDRASRQSGRRGCDPRVR